MQSPTGPHLSYSYFIFNFPIDLSYLSKNNYEILKSGKTLALPRYYLTPDCGGRIRVIELKAVTETVSSQRTAISTK